MLASTRARFTATACLALLVGACGVSTDREKLTTGEADLADDEGSVVVEGDIVLGPDDLAALSSRSGDKETFGLVVNDPAKLWPERRVPYVIEPGFEPAAVDRIKAAMTEWSTKAKFSFPARTNEAAFISFHPNQTPVCNSFIGRTGKGQVINLPVRASTCAAHEIGHAIGLYHEQSRGDRDKYIKIHLENVQPGLENNFAAALKGAEYVQPYDFDSIMHYPANAFSKNGKPTITKVDGTTTGFGQRTALSKSDVESIDIVYTKYRPSTGTTPPPPTATANRQLIEKYYKDILGRQGTASEVDAWLRQIDGGATRGTVAMSFVTSEESRQRYVGGVYGRVLGRAAEPVGLAHWSGLVAGSMSRETALARIAASPEAYARAGSASRPWVTSLYRVILGREPDAGGLDAWTARADRGASRDAIAEGFVQSDEHVNTLVNGFYVTYLRRAADPQGLATFVQAYRAGHRSEQIQAWILSSEEYFRRAP